MSSEPGDIDLRYAVDERPPLSLASGLGLQVVVLIIAGIVLTPAIVMRAAGASTEEAAWAVFAGLIICGITTALQAYPLGRIGAGYVLFMGTSGAFIAISIEAVTRGGLPLLASLVIASALVQFVFSHKLGALRRIITPTVGGTIIMLIAVTVFPICVKLLDAPLPGHDAGDPLAAILALLSFCLIVAISLFAPGQWRLWGPLIGIVAASALAAATGAFDFTPVAQADWIGFPALGWPGVDLGFGADFWLLLLPFCIVTIVGAIETYGDGIAIQRLSRRTNEPIDFRAVQGALNADGLGNLLSGMAGTLPNTTYSTSLSVVDLTGVAARTVGLFGGIFLFFIAFSPKVAALIIAIPSPIVAGYVLVLIILLFVHGLKLVTEGGLTYEHGLVVGIAFWLAMGFQNQQFFADKLPDWSRTLLDNGMTTGGMIAILLSLLLSLRRKKADRITVPVDVASISSLREFLDQAGTAAGWDLPARRRLELIGEEVMVQLIHGDLPKAKAANRQVFVRAEQQSDDRIGLEFVSGPSGANLQAAAARLGSDVASDPMDISMTLIARLTDQLRHMHFHDVEVIEAKVSSKVDNLD